MLKKEVRVGHYYVIRHHDSGPHKLAVIRIEGESVYGGWNAIKMKTGRMIRIKSATKLRGEVTLNPDWFEGAKGIKKWIVVQDPKKFQFEKGRRYRITILPAGARTRTITFDANYLWDDDNGAAQPTISVDCRPEAGTQMIYRSSLRDVKDIGPAIHA